MTRDDFWELVDRLIVKTRGNLEKFESALDEHLKSLVAEEIESFASHFAELQNEVNVQGIFDAALIIGCASSNDGFMDFRRWIVFQGRNAFQRIIQDPDYLGMYDLKSDPIEQWYSEYDPRWAYKEVTGNELPDCDVDVYPHTKSELDTPTKLAERYPTLWNRINREKPTQQERAARGRALFLGTRLVRIEADGDNANFVFSTGGEIRIQDYWPFYRTRYKVENGTPCYDDHPMLGQTVDSIETSNFPESFYMWFDNRKKLSLAVEYGVCSEFDVFDNGNYVE